MNGRCAKRRDGYRPAAPTDFMRLIFHEVKTDTFHGIEACFYWREEGNVSLFRSDTIVGIGDKTSHGFSANNKEEEEVDRIWPNRDTVNTSSPN